MTTRTQRILILATALIALPAALPAQQKPSKPAPAKSATAKPAPAKPATPAPAAAAVDPQALIGELQQIHARLEGLQAKALSDPQLSAAQTTLGNSIKAAMEKADPTLAASMTRAEELDAQAGEAQQKGDQAKLQQLATELQQIQEKFMTAQQKVLQQPEMAAQLEAFQTRVEKKMTELDPEAAKLMARFEALQQQLAAAMQTGPR